MKILLVHNRYKQPGGEDTVFLAEKELLIQRGHLVECLLFDNRQINTRVDQWLAGIKAVYNPQSARMLEVKIRMFCPDVVHIHNLFPIASPSIICTAKKWGLPVIVTLHNYRLLCPSATLFHNGQLYLKSLRLSFPWGAVFKGVYRNSVIETAALAFVTTVHRLFSTWQQKVDLYICLTHFAKKIHIESSLSIPQHKLVVKPNSVADYGNGITNRSDFYLFVGRLTEEKGIRTLLHAASLFNFELIMMGQGPLENEVTEFAQDYSNIHYLGFQDKESVLRYLKMCRALVMPSLWYEGLPVTLLEAFSTGTVVIASNLGALAEIIQDGVNGLLFEAGNSKELANTIAAIAENKYDMGRIRENARSTYLRHYTPDKNYHSLVNIYNKAIGMNEQAPVVLA